MFRKYATYLFIYFPGQVCAHGCFLLRTCKLNVLGRAQLHRRMKKHYFKQCFHRSLGFIRHSKLNLVGAGNTVTFCRDLSNSVKFSCCPWLDQLFWTYNDFHHWCRYWRTWKKDGRKKKDSDREKKREKKMTVSIVISCHETVSLNFHFSTNTQVHDSVKEPWLVQT